MRAPVIPFVAKLTLDWTFFGLTSRYRTIKEDQLFDLVYYGKNFSYTEVYNMPTYLRTYFIKKLEKIHKDRETAHEKQMRKTRSQSKSVPKRPNIRMPRRR